MIYEITENRVIIKPYLFDMDRDNNIHIYTFGQRVQLKTIINVGHWMTYNIFKKWCEEYVNNLDK